MTAGATGPAARRAGIVLLGAALLAALAALALARPDLVPQGGGPAGGIVARGAAFLFGARAGSGAWLMAALALALALAGGLARCRAPLAGFGAGMLVAGLAAELWLTRPLWFPSLRLRPEGPADLLMLGILAAEAGLAAAFLLARPAPLAALRRAAAAIGPARLALLLLLPGLWAISPAPALLEGSWAAQGARAAAGLAVALVHLGLLAGLAALPARAWPALRLSLPPAPAAALVAFLAALACGAWGFGQIPHVEDEVAYMFQARLFAGGALSAPAPPDPAAFDYYLLDTTGGRWFAAVPPGWPAALGLGVAAGLPWLVNPLLTGLGVLLMAAFAARATGDAVRGRQAAWLMAASPWTAGLGGSLMPHALCLALLLGAGCLLLLARDRPGPGRAGLVGAAGLAGAAGLLMGWVFLARPLEGLLLGGLAGLWTLRAFGWRGWPAILAYGAGCAALGGLVFPFNAGLTGDPLLPPLTAHLDRLWGPGANAWGFGAAIGPPGGWGALDLWPGHGPGEALANLLTGLSALDLDLWGAGAGSLLPVLAWALLAGGRRLAAERVLAGAALLLLLAEAGYWFTDAFYIGTRYWHPAMPALVLLTLGGAGALAARLRAGGFPEASGRVMPLLALSAAAGLLVALPWRMATKYPAYGDYHPDVPRRAAAGAFAPAAPGQPAPLVLVTPRGNIGPALFLNDPWLRPQYPVFARDPGPGGRAALEALFPGRPVILPEPAAP